MIMLGEMWLSLRRDTSNREGVLFVLGIDEEGNKEILNF